MESELKVNSKEVKWPGPGVTMAKSEENTEFVAGTQVVVVLESDKQFVAQTAYGDILAGAVAFTIAVGLGFRPGTTRNSLLIDTLLDGI